LSCAASAPVPSREAVLRYVVQFGNNSGLIRQLMRARQGWGPAPGDPGSAAGGASYQDKRVKLKASSAGPEINFLWTQYRCLSFLNAMAAGQVGVSVVLNEEKTLKLKVPSVPTKSKTTQPAPLRAHNHFEGSSLLCTKRGLCESLVSLFLQASRDPFGATPLTFIVRGGSTDPEFAEFQAAFQAIEAEASQRIWIVKPAEWANRGCGIRIYKTMEEIMQRVDSKDRVWAIQKYIEKPLLVHGRKFDIRAYCLVIQEPGGGPLRALGYRDAYLRTTSAQYTTKNLDRMVHLNNDAVQKDGKDYGKFESANKMSLEEFQKYLDEHHARDRVNVREQLMPQMHGLMADAIRSVASRLNPRGLDNCFEVFGFDFMVDANFRVWLIECNANPCLDLCSAYLSHLIPTMLEQALQLSLDRFAPTAGSAASESSQSGEAGTKWVQIFESSEDGSPEPSISCTWVEGLPAGTHAEQGTEGFSCHRAALGRQILRTAGRQKPRKGKQQVAQKAQEEQEPTAAQCILTGQAEGNSKADAQCENLSQAPA